MFTRPVTFKQNLPGSQGRLDVAATAQTDFALLRNGTSVGTCRFAAAALTATFIWASDQTFIAGDWIEVFAPMTPDATAAGLSLTLAGER